MNIDGREGRVLSVNVGRPRVIEWLGERAATSIWKSPVNGRVAVRGVNIEGDDQADRRAHGGTDKAIYSYAREDQEWWEQRLGRSIDAGGFGENLTLRGVDVTGAVIGERWAIGSVVLEVAQPRIPCWKLGARMGDPAFQQMFADGGKPGAYLRIVQEGEIGPGDQVRIAGRPSHGVTIGEVAEIYHNDAARAALLLEVPQLAEAMKRWARRRMRYAGQASGE